MMARALRISADAVTKEFRDGRVASRFAEHWVAELYAVNKVANANEAGYDAVLEGPVGDWRVSVKSLTKSGVKFQHSRYIGSGRSCSAADLEESIRDVDFVIVVDIREFPVVRTIPVAQETLLRLVDEGLLRPTGLSPEQFYDRVLASTPERLPWTQIPPAHE